MHTLQFQVHDDVYKKIVDKGIDINSQVKAFLNELVDDGYPSITTDEAKERISKAINDYNNGTMKAISHDDMWNSIDSDCR